MGMEYELKFAAAPELLERIAAELGSFSSIRMETTYYDTHDRALSAQHVTLRRRLENQKSVCTVKTPAPGGARGEWETECDCIEAAIPVLCKLGCSLDLPALTKEGLIPICGARFTRRAKALTLPGCTVEIALDQGVLLGGGRQQPLCELEVELKEGSRKACCAWSQALAERYGLIPEAKSKFRRALALAEGESYGL